MKKIKILLLCTLITLILSCGTLGAFLSDFLSDEDKFSNKEAVQALKEALNIGVEYASNSLHKKDGYYGHKVLKIMFPPEADIIIDNIHRIPFGEELLEDVIIRVNRSAEEAAKDIVPIFANAIREMTVRDGIEIVYGSDTAACDYLKEKTYDDLTALYQPKLQACLEKPLVMGVSADTAWRRLVRAYNKAGRVANVAARIMNEPEPMPRVNPDMSTFVTQKALDGVFYKVGQEEAKIRKDPFDYASKIINKVFGAVLKDR